MSQRPKRQQQQPFKFWFPYWTSPPPPPPPTAAARRSQPSPSSSESPSPSRKSSSKLNEAGQRGKQQSSPSRTVPAQQSPQGSSSTSQGAPDLQPPTAVSSSSLPEPTTKPPPSESETQEKAKTRFQPSVVESQPEEITNKKSEHRKLNEKPEDIPKEETMQPDLEPKQYAGTSKQQELTENTEGIPEDKTKPDFEPKQSMLTSQVSKLNESFEGIRREKQDIGTSIQKILDENSKSTQQDKINADLEPPRNTQTLQVPKVGENPEEITEEDNKDKSDRMHEEFNEEELQKNHKLQKELHPTVSETLNKKLERDLTIMGFDAEPPKPRPKTGDLISDARVGGQEKLITQQKLDGKETDKHESIGSVSRVSISAGPWTSSCGGERANFQKEIKEGLSKLVQKLGIGYSAHAGSDRGVSIITLAGKNKGAAMFIGNEGITKQGPKGKGEGKEEGKIEAKSDEKRYNDTMNGDTPFAASVNSNVQSINNSILNESKCKEENPGVHLVFSTKPTETMSLKGEMEALRTQKAASSITTPHKITYEPNIRRRCLRGLLMEPSEDDQEDSQKNRRHGCRFSCDEKKKGKENNDEGTSMPNRNSKS